MAEPSVLRAVLADDEPLARRTLAALIARHTGITLVAEAVDGEEALRAVREHRPHLLFLDVQMPGLDGFDVIEALDEPRPVTLFVTAYDRYALRAFEAQALDYLLKPFTDERFERALARALPIARLAAADDHAAALVGLVRAHRAHARRFMIRTAGRVLFLRAEEIDWIEAADYYARLHAKGQEHLLRESLQSLEASLDPEQFVRIHRSAIVNLDRVVTMRPLFHGEHQLTLVDGTELRLSRTRRDAFTARFRARH